MNIFRCQLILLVVALGGTAALGQAPVQVKPPSASQILVPQPTVDVNSPVTATATMDPPVAKPGETVFYRVTMDAFEGMIDWPKTISLSDGLRKVAATQGQIMQVIAGRFRPLTSFVYKLRATQPGHYPIPGFQVQVSGRTVAIPAAALDCVANKPDSVPSARELVLRASSTNVYLGEPFQLQVMLPTLPGKSIEAVREIQFIGDGFMNNKTSMRQTIQMVEYNGKKIPAYLFEQTATPIGAGERTLTAQGFTAGRQFGGPITITGKVVLQGGPPHYVLLMSNPLKINVRPLPVAGRLPGFTDGIGTFVCSPPQLSTNRLQVGVPIELKVSVTGEANAEHLTPPPAPRDNDWQIIRDPNGNFSYTLIPLTDQVKATPAIPFSGFNPETGKYYDLTIPSVPVTVQATKLPQKLSLPDYAESEKSAPRLSELAVSPGITSGLKPLQLRGWFVLVQFLPVVLFIDLWHWGRRRKYLEAHPEIVRRRRARRALRRENARRKKAVAAGDATAFLRHAAAALRIVCAPHYPANPQALVCADVLACLTVAERNEPPGDTVRKIFAAADAAFAAAPAARADLLVLEQNLAAALERLEARL